MLQRPGRITDMITIQKFYLAQYLCKTVTVKTLVVKIQNGPRISKLSVVSEREFVIFPTLLSRAIYACSLICLLPTRS